MSRSLAVLLFVSLVFSSGSFIARAASPGEVSTVAPSGETPPIVSGADGLGDIALVSSGARHFVVVTDRYAGIQVHASDRTTFRPDGWMSGVDAIADFSFSVSSRAPLVLAANQTTSELTLYQLDVANAELARVGAVSLPGSSLPGPVSAYRDVDGALYAFVALGTPSLVQQYRLTETTPPTATLVRTVGIGAEVVGLAVDPVSSSLYVSLGGQSAVRRYGAQTSTGEDWEEAGSELIAPLGGLDVFRPAPTGAGYLVVAEPSASRLAVLRLSDGAVLGRIAIGVGADGQGQSSFDATESARALALGRSPFSDGALAVGDTTNETGQNVKLVRWLDVANAFTPPLAPGDASAPDGGTKPGGSSGFPAGGGGGGGGSSFEEGRGCSAAPATPAAWRVAVLVLSLRGVRLRRRRHS